MRPSSVSSLTERLLLSLRPFISSLAFFILAAHRARHINRKLGHADDDRVEFFFEWTVVMVGEVTVDRTVTDGESQHA